MTFLEHDLKTKLANALWLLNSVDLAVRQADKLEEMNLKRVKARADDEMVRIFISGRDIRNIYNAIEDIDKTLRKIRDNK